MLPWQRHFNGDAGVLGRSVLIDGVATPVVGVLPATFRLDGSPDLLLPLALAAGSRDSATNLVVLARLAPGVSIDAASAAFDARSQAHAGEPDGLMNLLPLNAAIRFDGNAAAYAERAHAALRKVDARQGIAALRLLEQTSRTQPRCSA